MNHPAQGATGGWVMLGLVFKWLPLCEFSLLDASWGEGWHPTPVLLPGKSRVAGHGVAKGRTRLSDSLSLFTFMHWRRKWQPTPVFLPGESQGWGSLVGCRPWGCTELDMTEVT